MIDGDFRPAPENGGKTYIFKIRKGIKFSDGRELRVKDVVASLQRIFGTNSTMPIHRRLPII